MAERRPWWCGQPRASSTDGDAIRGRRTAPGPCVGCQRCRRRADASTSGVGSGSRMASTSAIPDHSPGRSVPGPACYSLGRPHSRVRSALRAHGLVGPEHDRAADRCCHRRVTKVSCAFERLRIERQRSFEARCPTTIWARHDCGSKPYCSGWQRMTASEDAAVAMLARAPARHDGQRPPACSQCCRFILGCRGRRRLGSHPRATSASGAYSALERRYLVRVERPHGLPTGARQRRVPDGWRTTYFRDGRVRRARHRCRAGRPAGTRERGRSVVGHRPRPRRRRLGPDHACGWAGDRCSRSVQLPARSGVVLIGPRVDRHASGLRACAARSPDLWQFSGT